ncbi:preprotein translocase subunit YajC [Gordonia sp. HY002]|uniref:preprotein translocase subunit YajC n=1 Tax=Gordonia zhenghanii TaxID=2911516 RepID=UPI001EEF7EE2|nr:preprotein translocase subunit YajC [Gordonia zhenghanii]MCF8569729.1 preprotein translocase subunit YajC [Gordonia zhenghanii]MCF8603237.1 preprotein translocase subunit YajC [Gordonia zhenghanii]
MSSSLIIPLMLAAMAVFMFVSVRNQKKRAAAAADMQSSVGPGTRVQLQSGLFGTVVDSSDGDVVQIEIAPGVVTEWNRLAIRETVADPSTEAALDESSADDFHVPDSLEGLDSGESAAGGSTSGKPNLDKSSGDESGDDKPEEK